MIRSYDLPIYILYEKIYAEMNFMKIIYSKVEITWKVDLIFSLASTFYLTNNVSFCHVYTLKN